MLELPRDPDRALERLRAESARLPVVVFKASPI